MIMSRNMRILLTLALLFSMSLSTFADNTVKATDAAVDFVGRVQRQADGSVRYDWTGTYARTEFNGTGISMRVSEEGESWYNVFIDGNLKGKIQVKGSEPHDVVLAEKLRSGTHRLLLQKCTEGEYGRTTVFSFTARGKGTFRAVPRCKRMIEVIGDSYTCGYGTDGANEKEHFKLSTEDCNKAYACIIARYFNADYCLVAHSGMGAIRNYNGKTMKNMSQRYPLLFDDHDSVAYDFKAYTPDLVIINLGTNDFSVQAAPAGYVPQYVKLIKTVRSHYNNVPVLCVVPHSANIFLLAALQEVRERVADMKNVRVAQPMPNLILEGQDYGSDYHPNWKGQQKIAMTLIPQVASLTGWELSNDL